VLSFADGLTDEIIPLGSRARRGLAEEMKSGGS